MEAPPENFAYTFCSVPTLKGPTPRLIDVKPSRPTVLARFPHRDDAVQRRLVPPFSAGTPAVGHCRRSTGHAFSRARYLIIPGIRSSALYVVDTQPDPTPAKISQIHAPDEVSRSRLPRPTRSLRSRRHIRQPRLAAAARMAPWAAGNLSWNCETFRILGAGRSTLTPET